MATSDPLEFELAREIQNSLATGNLRPEFARLYSHYNRVRARQPGLPTWGNDDVLGRLDDAVHLVEASLVTKYEAANQATDTHLTEEASWTVSMRRAGELLEWLSYPDLNSERLPLRLLSAAAYQLAGYPARAVGLLNEYPPENDESEILTAFLKADFPRLFRLLVQYWSRNEAFLKNQPRPRTGTEITKTIQELIVDETISSLGVLCAEMRWGGETRLGRALDKLSSISKVILYGSDAYSWLLAKLTSQVASQYPVSSMRWHLAGIEDDLDAVGKVALERYMRQAYQSRRSLIWVSQIRGVGRLLTRQSFALCTPTGSGKTTVAELAILQSLFTELSNKSETAVERQAPLVLYLVPTRALAAEVEAKLSIVLRRLADPVIIVTGLYGGTDWGPTDAWLTTDEKTILICTYEKAEALIRFMGPLFLNRVSQVIIDEAHMIQYNGQEASLRTSENRSLRLESLAMRLLTHLDSETSRVIALSAVAAGVEETLANWVTGTDNAVPERTTYRSTRQLIGRLECLPERRYQISYDLLDGYSLQFRDGTGTPYIPSPFPPHPPVRNWPTGPEKKLRPYLFWAALNLAARDQEGHRRTVLISISQHPEWYAKDLLDILDNHWLETELPQFFQEPTEPSKRRTWERCLAACNDYFGETSREYRLLQRGIVLHHGQMPGLLARLLVEVIQEQIVSLILATSTLSEGVNLPVEIILIPSLKRGNNTSLTAREFANLVGRAGRPGFGTEGITLVLVEPVPSSQQFQQYIRIIRELQQYAGVAGQGAIPSSPLAALLSALEQQYYQIAPTSSREDFLAWLEVANPSNETTANISLDLLDALDGHLLAAVVEVERLGEQELDIAYIEEQLLRVWQRSYARFASQQERHLQEAFVTRGTSLISNILTDPERRRRLYRTNLTPRHGRRLLDIYPLIRENLQNGGAYARWSADQRFSYIAQLAAQVSQMPSFNIADPRGQVTWREILRWWLDPSNAPKLPTEEQVSVWHNYTKSQFIYKLNWALGSIVGLILDDLHGPELHAATLEEWPQTGAPWIVFWLKELITWGTLDPVAAYLLARNVTYTRPDAEQIARAYYELNTDSADPNNLLNASKIREWTESLPGAEQAPLEPAPLNRIKAELLRDFGRSAQARWRVLPVHANEVLYWVDAAGYPLAVSPWDGEWRAEYMERYDFILDVPSRAVFSERYL